MNPYNILSDIYHKILRIWRILTSLFNLRKGDQMKNALIIMLITILLSMTQSAKSQFAIEAQGGISMPQDSALNVNGIQGGMTLTYAIAKGIDIMTTLQYQRFVQTTESNLGFFNAKSTTTIEYMPIMVGGRYTFTMGGIQPFISAMIGPSNGNATIVLTSNIGAEQRLETSEKFTTVSLSGGLLFPLNAHMSLMGMAEYLSFTNEDESDKFLIVKGGIRYEL